MGEGTPRLLINRERVGEAHPLLRMLGYQSGGFCFDEGAGNYRYVSGVVTLELHVCFAAPSRAAWPAGACCRMAGQHAPELAPSRRAQSAVY